MAELGLRPLSLGEILDRTFSLYRRNFLLFLGITAIPHLLILALNLCEVFLVQPPVVPVGPSAGNQLPSFPSFDTVAFTIGGAVVGLVVYMVAFLFSQAGTIYAVSELYLGRTTTIGDSLRKAWGHLANLFGVTLLNGFVVGIGFVLLIIPGIYLACRLITCVPAALLEDLGPRSSLERSYHLTQDNAGRAFLIYLLYVVMLYASILLLVMPFSVLAAMSVKNPGMLHLWAGLLAR